MIPCKQYPLFQTFFNNGWNISFCLLYNIFDIALQEKISKQDEIENILLIEIL